MTDESKNPNEAPQPAEPTTAENVTPEAVAPPPTPEELDELRRKSAEYDALMDRLKRVTADFINSQKRLEREMLERAQYTLEGFARELLPVADNLESALRAAKEHEAFEKIIAGVEQIEKQIRDIFAKHGIRQIEARAGEPFNTDVHEAISLMESTEHESDKVLHQTQKGYTIHNRLLRPVRVVISKKPEEGG